MIIAVIVLALLSLLVATDEQVKATLPAGKDFPLNPGDTTAAGWPQPQLAIGRPPEAL